MRREREREKREREREKRESERDRERERESLARPPSRDQKVHRREGEGVSEQRAGASLQLQTRAPYWRPSPRRADVRRRPLIGGGCGWGSGGRKAGHGAACRHGAVPPARATRCHRPPLHPPQIIPVPTPATHTTRQALAPQGAHPPAWSGGLTGAGGWAPGPPGWAGRTRTRAPRHTHAPTSTRAGAPTSARARAPAPARRTRTHALSPPPPTRAIPRPLRPVRRRRAPAPRWTRRLTRLPNSDRTPFSP